MTDDTNVFIVNISATDLLRNQFNCNYAKSIADALFNVAIRDIRELDDAIGIKGPLHQAALTLVQEIINPFPLVENLIRYASNQPDFGFAYSDAYPNEPYINDQYHEDIVTLNTFYLQRLIPKSHSIEYEELYRQLSKVSQIADARHRIDTYLPVSINQLALISNRKPANIHRYIQNLNIQLISSSTAPLVPVKSALTYLQTSKIWPYTEYNQNSIYQGIPEEPDAYHRWLEQNRDLTCLACTVDSTLHFI